MNNDDHNPYEEYDRQQPARAAGPKGKTKRPGRLWRLGTLASGMLTFALIAVAAVIGAIYVLTAWFDRPGPLAKDTTVLVSSGAGLSGISRSLERNGVIADSDIFAIGVMVNRAENRLQAGEYLFEANISMEQVLDKLVSGKSIRYKITLAEGLSTAQIVERLNDNDILVGEIKTAPEEGSLLPETYLFQRGISRAEIIRRMQDAQKKALAALWPKRADGLAVKTPEEALTLASIVEKETGIATERARVAAVFHNRLKKSIRLQSDPTIIYGINAGKGPLGRPIKKSEIDAKNAYNTYQIDGLPPTPIANPGRASIEAVLNPAKTDDLYFVADGSGGHVFSETLADHNRNVANWRKVQSEARRKQEEAEAKKTGGDASKSDTGKAGSSKADAVKSDAAGDESKKPATE